jgi:hypothetical protein
MKHRRPDWKDWVILAETFLLFFLLFHYWDEVLGLITGIFT